MENPGKIGTDECVYRGREEILTGESAPVCRADSCLLNYRHRGDLGTKPVIRCEAPEDKA